MTLAKQLAVILLCVCLSVAALVGVREWQLTNRQIRSAINEGQWLIAEARPEAKSILSQAKQFVFEARTQTKAFGEDLNSREQQRARLATMRAGESVAALAEQLRAETIPRLNADLDSLNAAIQASDRLIARTDTQLNEQLLPEATRTLAALGATARTFDTDGKAILAEILALSRQGTVTLEQVNRTLASPLWLQTLSNVERSTANVAEATKELPATAASVERILKTAAAYQKPLLIASLLATLARALFP